MTENGKIFLIKKSIFNLLSQQQFSVGLSLYIIQDIERELQQTYNKVLLQELQQQENKILQKQTNNQQKNQEVVDMTSTKLTVSNIQKEK